MKRYLIVFLIFCLSACNKKDPQTQYLKCKVLSTKDISCNIPILDFSDDSLAIKRLTGKQDILYVVKELSANLNEKDMQLYVTVRELKQEEAFPCLAIGVWYPSLMITDAKRR